jgi:hypothetical protein
LQDTSSEAIDPEEMGIHPLWTDHNKALDLAGYDLEIKKPVFGGFMTTARRAESWAFRSTPPGHDQAVPGFRRRCC